MSARDRLTTIISRTSLPSTEILHSTLFAPAKGDTFAPLPGLRSDAVGDTFAPLPGLRSDAVPVIRFGETLYVSPEALRHGWIYLGKYTGGGVWVQPRSEDLLGNSPEALPSERITLNRPVNVRAAAFTCFDTDTKVTSNFETGATVQVLQLITLEGCSRHVWAEVEER
jgi:hypothetical protein